MRPAGPGRIMSGIRRSARFCRSAGNPYISSDYICFQPFSSSILDHGTREFYIRMELTSCARARACTPKGPLKSKENAHVCRELGHAAEHEGTICGDGDGRPGLARGERAPRL